MICSIPVGSLQEGSGPFGWQNTAQEPQIETLLALTPPCSWLAKVTEDME